MASAPALSGCTTAYSLAEALAQLCTDPHPERDGWRARCPNHQGQSNTSLLLTPHEDRVIVKCFAGCATADIMHALGLTMADRFVRTSQTTHRNGTRHIAQVYDYYDATGTLVHQTVRFEPKSFSQRRPDPANPGSFVWNLKTIEPVLYHLPEVLDAVANGTPIYIVEGEKDADTLHQRGLVATCNPMGAKKWRASYTKTLRGAHVILLADHDGPGRAHVEMIAQALLGVVADIKLVYAFHTDAPGSDVSDWIAAGHSRVEFETIIEQTPLWDGVARDQSPDASQGWVPSVPLPPSSLPPGRVIEQYRHLLPSVVSQAEEALQYMPGAPLVFQRARRLVAIAPAEKTIRGITRAHGTPIISALTTARLRFLLATAAAWLSPSPFKKDHALHPDMPAFWVVETLLDQEAWTFPPLTGIVNSPTVRRDGTLITTQGYDAETGLWLAWNDDQFPSLAEHPTRRDAQTALHMLAEPFQDFPFAEPHHWSAAIAAVLTLIARYAVQNVPLFAIRATTRGSGKTLLADTIAMIATGRHAPKMPQVKEEEEERKRLLALALDGDPLVVIDNVVGALGNPALDLAVTSQLFKDRLLGKNATKEAPLYTVFLATGNNIFFKGDMARRALPIDLAPMVEQPETRSGFTHPHLLEWVAEERPRLLSAALTLLRAYWVAGKPRQPIDPYGSFEAWSDLIRSALVWTGAPDPCLGREGLEAASDETFEAHTELLAAWHDCYQSQPITLPQIIGDIQTRGSLTNTPNTPNTLNDTDSSWDRLREALGFFDPRFDGHRLNSKALGHALKRLCGRVIDGKHLRQMAGRSKYGIKWCVQSTPVKPTRSGVFDVLSVNDSLATREGFLKNVQNRAGGIYTDYTNTPIPADNTSDAEEDPFADMPGSDDVPF